MNSFNLSNSPSSLRKQDAYAQKMTDLELQSQETDALLKTSERPKKRALAIQIVALCGAAALAGAALASRAGPNDLAVMTSLPDSWISHASCSRSFPSRGARSRRRRMRTRRRGVSLEISY